MSDGDPTLNTAGTPLPAPPTILEPDNQQKNAVCHDESCADNDLTCSEYLSLTENHNLETASAATSNDQNDSDCSEFLDAREVGKEKYTGHSRRSSLSSVVDGFLDECMNKIREHERVADNLEKAEEPSKSLRTTETQEKLNDPNEIPKTTDNTVETDRLQEGEPDEIVFKEPENLRNNINLTEDVSEHREKKEGFEHIVNENLQSNLEKTNLTKPLENDETVQNDQENHQNNSEQTKLLQSNELEGNLQNEHVDSKINIEKNEEALVSIQKKEQEENINNKQDMHKDAKNPEASEPPQNKEEYENVTDLLPSAQEDNEVKAQTNFVEEVKVKDLTIKSEEAPVENLSDNMSLLIEKCEPDESEPGWKETTCPSQKDTSPEELSDLMDDRQAENKSSQFQLDMEKEGFSLGCNLSLTTVFDEKGLAIAENEKICELREMVSKLEVPHVLEKNLNLKMDPNEMANTITNNIISKIATKKSQTSITDNQVTKENQECTQLDKMVEHEKQHVEAAVPETDEVLNKTTHERESPEKVQVELEEPLIPESPVEKRKQQELGVIDDLHRESNDFKTIYEVKELCIDLVNTVAGPMTPSEMNLYKTFSDVKPQNRDEDSSGDVFSPVIQSPPSVYEFAVTARTCEESLIESNERPTLERKKSLVAGEDNGDTLLNTQSTDRTELSEKEKEILLVEDKKDIPSEENTVLTVKRSGGLFTECQQVNPQEDVTQEPCTLSSVNLNTDAAKFVQQEQSQSELEVQSEISENMEKTSPRPKKNEGIMKLVEKTEQAGSGMQSSITYKKVIRSNRIPVIKAESPTRMKPLAPKITGCSENTSRSLVQNATLLSLKERMDAVRNRRHELSPKLKQGKGEYEKVDKKQTGSPTRKDKENAPENANEETLEQAVKQETQTELDTKAQELRNEEGCLEEDEAEEEMENNLTSSSVKSLKTCSEGRSYKKNSSPPLPPGKLSALMTRYRNQLKRYNNHLADFEAYQERIKSARENLRIIQGQMIASSGDGPEGFTVPELPPNVVCNPPVPSETLKLLESENKKLKESMNKKSEELTIQKEKITVLKNDVKALEEKVSVYQSGAEKPKVEESEKLASFQAQISKLKQQLDDEIAQKATLEKKKNGEVANLSNKIKCEITKREQLQKSLLQKAEEVDMVRTHTKELKSEKDTLQSTLEERSSELEKFKKESQKLSDEMALKEQKISTVETSLQEERKLNNDLKVQLENLEKERAETCQRIMQLSDLLVEKADQIEEHAELLNKEHTRNSKLVELFRNMCSNMGCDLDSETLNNLMNSDVQSQENINKIKLDIENVINEQKEELLKKEVIISSLKMDLKEKEKLLGELLEFSEIKNAGVCKKSYDDEKVHTTNTREAANMCESSTFITPSKDMQRVNTQELMELLETKRHAMQRMEKQIKDLQHLHSYCGMRRTLQESKIAELELTLAGYLD